MNWTDEENIDDDCIVVTWRNNQTKSNQIKSTAYTVNFSDIIKYISSSNISKNNNKLIMVYD